MNTSRMIVVAVSSLAALTALGSLSSSQAAGPATSTLSQASGSGQGSSFDSHRYGPPRRADGSRESVMGSANSGQTHVPGVDSASSRFTGGGSE